MDNKENKNTYKENEKNIEDIYVLLENLNKNQLEFVRHFVRGLLKL